MSLPIHLEVIQAKRRSEGGGGGGSPQWYDSAAIGDLTSGSSQIIPDSLYGAKVTVSTGGNATKLRFYAETVVVGSKKFKFGLYNSSKNLVVGSTEQTSTQNFSPHYVEVSIASTAISAGDYYVALVADSANDPNFYNKRKSSGSDGFYKSSSYPGAMPAAFSGETTQTAGLFGVYVE